LSDSNSETQGTAGQQAGPCMMILFGAGGDLTKRKLMPAIYNLAKSKLLPEQFAIVGVSIESYSIEDFRKLMTEDIGSIRAKISTQNAGNGSRSGSTTCPVISKIPDYTRSWRM